MKPRTFFIIASLLILIAGVISWNIISDYYERQDKIDQGASVVTMYKNPGCECCDRWAEYMQRNGYKVTVHASRNTNAIKGEYGVPREMRSCHTAIVDGYVVEGHVPVEDVNRLISERPEAVGIATPGMPASSPGMNTALNEPFEVYLFDDNGHNTVYARH